MIIEFTIGLALLLAFAYFSIKLWNKWQIRKLNKKYPEGSVNKSIKVSRLDEIPIASVPVADSSIIDKLKK